MDTNRGKQDHWEIIMSIKQEKKMSLGLEIEKQAHDNPDKPFLVFGEQTISYSQFNKRANRYANFFHEQGFQKGDVVVLLMDNRPEYLDCVTGLSKLGVITALVHIGIRGEVLARDINLTEARAIIVGQEVWEPFSKIIERVRLKSPARIFIENHPDNSKLPSGVENINQLITNVSEQDPETTAQVSSEDILTYMYTSGNTGLRKAVPILQKRWLLVGHQMCSYSSMTSDNVLYVSVPLFFNSGFNVCFAGTVISGGTMVLRPDFSASKFWSDVRRHGVTHFMSVGEMCQYIYNQPEKADDRDNPLQYVISNSISADLIDLFRQRYSVAHIIEIYGTTESVGSFVNIEEIAGMCGSLNLNGLRQGEVARYNFDQSEIEFNADGRAIKCQIGETGILLCEINELNPFDGYINDMESSEAKIMQNVFIDGDKYYRTDDLVTLHENEYISFVDRLGETYRWKGKTVSAEAVADVISKFFGGIEEVAAYGVKIPGYGGRSGMAAIKMITGEKLDLKKLTGHIASRMPEHARPNFIRICGQNYDEIELEEVKRDLKLEGYYPGLIKDALYYFDSGKNDYQPLTSEIYDLIMDQKIRF